MAVVSVAVCPHPPLLVPEVAAGAAHELDDLRRACDAAIHRMLERCDEVRLLVSSAGLPSAVEIGRWLLDRNDSERPVSIDVVDAETSGAPVPTGGRQGLLVMADGSARRTPKAPGAFHPDADGFDAGIEALLASGRVPQLGAAAEMWCTDAPALLELVRTTSEAEWDRDLLYAAAPYGVAYFVASWVRAGA